MTKPRKQRSNKKTLKRNQLRTVKGGGIYDFYTASASLFTTNYDSRDYE